MQFVPSRSILLILVSLAAVLILSNPISAQSCVPGELRVFVADSQEGPIFDAHVKVAAESEFGDKVTQSGGIADFSKVPCGVWNVTASKDGFESAFKVVDITSGGNSEVSILLSPKGQRSSLDRDRNSAPS